MKYEAWRLPPKVPRRELSVRVVAVKTAVRDLKPGDLFSDKDGSYWNHAMSGHALPEALICTNEATDEVLAAAGPDSSEYVYRLTIVREQRQGEDRVEERDTHKSVIVDPYAPPGVLK